MTLTTRQEIFDTVARHLLTQNERSVSAHLGAFDIPHCRYRGKNGLTCAVGCLISDDQYYPSLEGCGASSPDVLNALKHSGVKGLDEEATKQLLRDLQYTHDNTPLENWSAQLQRDANYHDLRWNF